MPLGFVRDKAAEDAQMTKPLRRCPECSRRLPQRNAVHVCRPPVPVARFFRLTEPRQLDARLREYLAVSYRVGQQEHLR